MHKLIQALLLAAGSFGLFSGALVGFARLRGTPAHELPMVGGLFTPPEDPEGEPVAGEPADPPPQADSQQRPRQAGLGLLDVFRIDSPLEAAELQELAQALKRQKAQVERRELELDQREQRLDDRAGMLDEQFGSLAQLRGGLEQWQRELEERQAEVERDEGAQAEREAESWSQMARLFEKGEADSLARRLEAWTPAKAARMLVHLKPDRARELLEALRGEDWQDYWEAYRLALPEEAR